MLSIEIEDVMGVLKSCIPQIAVIGIAVVLMLIAMAVCFKMKKSKKFLVRTQAAAAALVVIAVSVNSICFGPMSTLISLSTGNGTIAEETSNEAMALCTEIAEEGIVLLKNDSQILPLSDTSNLNVFGWSSTNPCYGGTGSGSISENYEKITLLQGLSKAGFQLNTELSDFYTAYRDSRPIMKTTGANMDVEWTLPEPPVDSYPEAMVNNSKSFSDTALIVITRIGGEGVDLPTDVNNWFVGEYKENSDKYKDFDDGEHYLELSNTEEQLLSMVCSNFENVVVVYNGANTMELGFVGEYPQIKGLVWCPGPGQTGFKALGEILRGTVNPSGRTSDIFVRDLTKTPAYNNAGRFFYSNAEEFQAVAGFAGGGATQEIIPAFVNYTEGIYNGYRFYETAAQEGFIDYEKEVQFPFGYGMSYTQFKQEMGEINEKNGVISFDVTVTNTGTVEGRDVVEVYYNPPYTNGGIEKAAANLAAFDKTQALKPGESETMTLAFNVEDMASYDEKVNRCYVLEAGNYGISIRKDSHSVIDEKNYIVSQNIIYDKDNKRASDEVSAVNQFDQAEGNLTYLSRAGHFANYEEAIKAPENFSITEEARAEFTNSDHYNPEDHNNPADEMPLTGARNGIQLAGLRGLDYDDPMWDQLLDQLTVEEMDSIIALGGYQTAAIESIGKIRTNDCDGPASIKNNFTEASSIGFPTAVMIAATWNERLAERFGESIGKMAEELDVSGWYAPAMNGHRTAFSGRNFEYYSEDGFLSGKMAANAVQGAKKYGVYSYLKHYALNDQESNRHNMLNTWLNEQALREIYLKPFEIAVKQGGAQAIMTAFNYIGATWCGGSDALLNKVLRDEWGFRGFVLTDYFGRTYFMNSDQAIRNGNDAMLVAYDVATNHVKDQTSATSVKAMRQASKNILYTVVNSRAYAQENTQSGPMGWELMIWGIDGVLGLALVVMELTVIRKEYLKRRKEEE